ncbi:MAG: ABC transporter permease [Oscillospiraceae bacterium]|jgi:ABC-2 type transport system permease protein|nr:ABC transporter permease [Oscillospiraceae bacterium]
MSISPVKLWALLKKDIKDTLKNPQCLLMMGLPLVFALLYQSMDLGMPGEYVLMLCLLMNMSITGVSCMAMMIAEEKEKYTLRTLMLSNVSAAEFLLSKALVVLGITELGSLLIFFITGSDAALLPRYLAVTIATCLCLLILGALVGIISKNQMTTGIFAAPAMLILMLPPMLAEIDATYLQVARFTPTYSMVNLLFKEGDRLFSIAVLAGWIVLSALLFALAYRRKRLD